MIFRVRILDELEPGAIFSLWRASLGRYVLDEDRSQQLFSEFFIWDDFPSQPGEVRCICIKHVHVNRSCCASSQMRCMGTEYVTTSL